jgi:hypothetical protein
MSAAGRLPDFLLIGATKCGTTSLHRWLRAHPEIFMPEKEVRFFTTEHNWGRGLDWYRSRFAAAEAARAVGEASNSYTRHPVYAGVPDRIAETLPEVRLVYVARNPMRRLESHYRHRLATGWEWRGADAAIAEDPRYVAASLYGAQMAEYLRRFDRSRILLLRAERLFADPGPELDALCRFLGVAPDRSRRYAAENVSAERRAAPRLLRELNRFKATRGLARRAARAVRRTPLARLGPPADRPEFRLGPERRAALTRLFEEDARRLAALMGETAREEAASATEAEAARGARARAAP